MAFWTSVAEGAKDPKRNFRFKVMFNNLVANMVWFAKSVDKPNFSVQESSHKFLNHTYYFPARVEWQEITMKFVDPVAAEGEDFASGTVAKLNELFINAGYVIPTNPSEAASLETQSKSKSREALGPIIIEQIDSDGNAVESWTLHHPFIKKITYGNLAYDNDELTEMEIALRYDWATCDIGGTKSFTTET